MNIKDLTDLEETSTYLKRINAEPRSLLKAVVMEQHGDYWTDISVIRFEKNGDISVSAFAEKFEPTDSERELIKEEFSGIDWPSHKNIIFLILTYQNFILKPTLKIVLNLLIQTATS